LKVDVVKVAGLVDPTTPVALICATVSGALVPFGPMSTILTLNRPLVVPLGAVLTSAAKSVGLDPKAVVPAK